MKNKTFRYVMCIVCAIFCTLIYVKPKEVEAQTIAPITKTYKTKSEIPLTIQETVNGQLVTFYKDGEPTEKIQEVSKDIHVDRGFGLVIYYAKWQGTDTNGYLTVYNKSNVWSEEGLYSKMYGLSSAAVDYISYKGDGSDYLNLNFDSTDINKNVNIFPVQEGGRLAPNRGFDETYPVLFEDTDGSQGLITMSTNMGIDYRGTLRNYWDNYEKVDAFGNLLQKFGSGSHSKTEIPLQFWKDNSRSSNYVVSGKYGNELFHYKGTFRKVTEYTQKFSTTQTIDTGGPPAGGGGGTIAKVSGTARKMS